MDAPPASRATAPAIDGRVVSQLIVAGATVLLALVALTACYVWVRRATGALVEPLPAAAMVAAGAALAVTAVLFRLGCSGGNRSNRVAQYMLWAAPTAAVATAAGALSLADSSPGALLGLWGLVALEEGWSWERVLRGAKAPAVLGVHRGATFKESPAQDSLTSLPVEIDQSDQEHVSQYLVRRQNDQGGETMDGWIRAEFVPAQRHAIAHVAICPPFEQTPRCYAEIADGPAGEVKIGQLLAYGVRFEIKLDQPAVEATSVTVEFSIQELGALDDDRGEGDET